MFEPSRFERVRVNCTLALLPKLISSSIRVHELTKLFAKWADLQTNQNLATLKERTPVAIKIISVVIQCEVLSVNVISQVTVGHQEFDILTL